MPLNGKPTLTELHADTFDDKTVGFQTFELSTNFATAMTRIRINPLRIPGDDAARGLAMKDFLWEWSEAAHDS